MDSGATWTQQAPLPFRATGMTHVHVTTRDNKQYHVLLGGRRSDGSDDIVVGVPSGGAAAAKSGAIFSAWRRIAIKRMNATIEQKPVALGQRLRLLATWLKDSRVLMVAGGFAESKPANDETFDNSVQRWIDFDGGIQPATLGSPRVDTMAIHGLLEAIEQALSSSVNNATAPAAVYLRTYRDQLPKSRQSLQPDVYLLRSSAAEDGGGDQLIFQAGLDVYTCLIFGHIDSEHALRQRQHYVYGVEPKRVINAHVAPGGVGGTGVEAYDPATDTHYTLTAEWRGGRIYVGTTNNCQYPACHREADDRYATHCIASPYDSVCSPCSKCAYGLQYAQELCQRGADRVCSACMPCPVGTAVVLPCGHPENPSKTMHVCGPAGRSPLMSAEQVQATGLTLVAETVVAVVVCAAIWARHKQYNADCEAAEEAAAAGKKVAALPVFPDTWLWLLVTARYYATVASVTCLAGVAASILSRPVVAAPNDERNTSMATTALLFAAPTLSLLATLAVCKVLPSMELGSHLFRVSRPSWAVILPVGLMRPQLLVSLHSLVDAHHSTASPTGGKTNKNAAGGSRKGAGTRSAAARIQRYRFLYYLTLAVAFLIDLPLGMVAVAFVMFTRDVVPAQSTSVVTATAASASIASMSTEVSLCMAYGVLAALLQLWHLLDGLLAAYGFRLSTQRSKFFSDTSGGSGAGDEAADSSADGASFGSKNALQRGQQERNAQSLSDTSHQNDDEDDGSDDNDASRSEGEDYSRHRENSSNGRSAGVTAQLQAIVETANPHRHTADASLHGTTSGRVPTAVASAGKTRHHVTHLHHHSQHQPWPQQMSAGSIVASAAPIVAVNPFAVPRLSPVMTAAAAPPRILSAAVAAVPGPQLRVPSPQPAQAHEQQGSTDSSSRIEQQLAVLQACAATPPAQRLATVHADFFRRAPQLLSGAIQAVQQSPLPPLYAQLLTQLDTLHAAGIAPVVQLDAAADAGHGGDAALQAAIQEGGGAVTPEAGGSPSSPALSVDDDEMLPSLL